MWTTRSIRLCHSEDSLLFEGNSTLIPNAPSSRMLYQEPALRTKGKSLKLSDLASLSTTPGGSRHTNSLTDPQIPITSCGPQRGWTCPCSHWQAISQLISISDIHDSKERFPPSRCDPGTRRKILSEIEWWTGAGRGATKFLWLQVHASSLS